MIIVPKEQQFGKNGLHLTSFRKGLAEKNAQPGAKTNAIFRLSFFKSYYCTNILKTSDFCEHENHVMLLKVFL